MAKKAPIEDAGDALLAIGHPKTYGVGVPGVVRALTMSTAQMGVKRTVLTLTQVNQKEGFDCPGCAWPDPSHRHVAEFCENGAKAVAEEATLRRVTRDFFAEHAVADLATRSDHWLGQQGRLTEPMLLVEGGTHYEPISWDAAFDLIATELRSLADPDEAIFYTSGRTSNEAAFAYQLFVRAFGTNNLPDCSNMCHESSGAALGQTLGIGKGTVTLTDFEHSDLVIIAGQNPGTNHPRMLSSLERVKANGGRIIAVNPLIEAGLKGFRNPQSVKGVLLGGVELTDDYVQLRLNGDLAFFAGLNKLLLEADALDHTFIDEHTSGFDEARAHLEQLDWADLERASGLTRADFERVAEQVKAASSIVVCWAMGLTQHKNSVPSIREIVNFLLLRGNMGRPGAGACPVRGHSNVQGDRTVGINERPPQFFLDALKERFGFEPPRDHGTDVVEAIRRMRDGRCGVFLAVGGNFVRATPDSAVTEAAMRNVGLTVHVSTKLNGSHAVTGRRALILPTLGRTERDDTDGREQFVTVEDSMGMVHASRGRLDPASAGLRSEVDIVCTLAERTLGTDQGIDWAAMRADYATIRGHIEAVIPGFDDYERKVIDPDGFALPNGPRDSRTFNNRGITAGRRVVFIHPDDRAERGFADGDIVDLVSIWPGPDGAVEERRAHAFRLVDYPTARGCVASYFPETNLLVPLDSVADESGTPTSKSIVVRLEPADDSPIGWR